MNTIYQEVLDTINDKRLDNMCDISTACAQIMYRELMKKFDTELPDNYDELIRYFLKEEKETQSALEKKELKVIVNVMKLTKYFEDMKLR